MKKGFGLFSFLVFAMIFSFMLSGCTLLQLPVKMVEGTFGLLTELVKLAGKMPLPPPGVF